jgi:hypothetical protein
METVTHQQIYDRLVTVEGKVDDIDANTKVLVDGFKAMQGAFIVLGWLAKAAKPILWIIGGVSAVVLFWDQLLKK